MAAQATTVNKSSEKLQTYRASAKERERQASIERLVGTGNTLLEIGARDGHYTRLMQSRFQRVSAIDIVPFEVEGADCRVADVCDLPFADKSFDVVLCAEVLEHIPSVEKAASEIARVARKSLVVGVPYRQDLRAGKTTCSACGQIRPAWGHVHSFDESKLARLFPGLRPEFEFVGRSDGGTTALASALMTYAGNPWGAYNEECSACGTTMTPAIRRSLLQRAAGFAAVNLDKVQARLATPHANWIHAKFSRA